MNIDTQKNYMTKGDLSKSYCDQGPSGRALRRIIRSNSLPNVCKGTYLLHWLSAEVNSLREFHRVSSRRILHGILYRYFCVF